jgi:uncharacterized protein YqiB (DUF1249 family)
MAGEKLHKLQEIISLYFELLDMKNYMRARHLFVPSKWSKESVVRAIEEYEELLECVEVTLRKEVD